MAIINIFGAQMAYNEPNISAYTINIEIKTEGCEYHHNLPLVMSAIKRKYVYFKCTR
jgi:hypothetical protein